METRNQILSLFLTLQINERIPLLEELIFLATQEEAVLSDIEDTVCLVPTLVPPQTEERPEAEEDFLTSIESPICLIPTLEKIQTAEGFQVEKNQSIVLASEPIIKQNPPCPECHSTHVIKWGSYKGAPRSLCKDCKHTFTPFSGDIFYHSRKPDKFEQFGKKMFNGQYASLSYLSDELEISTKTAFEWRHKYLSALSSEGQKEHFGGITEIDDVWFVLNEKGRENKNESRKRGGMVKQGDNDMQVKVLFTSERQGETNISVVRAGRLKAQDVQRAVGGCFEDTAKIVCDKHPSILSFAKHEQIAYDSFKSEEHVKDKTTHVQTINNMALRFGNIINRKMNGVATKYLQNYANWFKIQERYKQSKDKLKEKIATLAENTLAWKYYINLEKIYQLFIEKFSRLSYEHPVEKQWKSQAWTYGQIKQVIL